MTSLFTNHKQSFSLTYPDITEQLSEIQPNSDDQQLDRIYEIFREYDSVNILNDDIEMVYGIMKKFEGLVGMDCLSG